jgi:putative transposase
VKAFLNRPLDHAPFPYVYLDATYLHGCLGRNLQVVSRAVVVAIGINALGYREVLSIALGDSEVEGFWRQFLAGDFQERCHSWAAVQAACTNGSCPGSPSSSGG